MWKYTYILATIISIQGWAIPQGTLPESIEETDSTRRSGQKVPQDVPLLELPQECLFQVLSYVDDSSLRDFGRASQRAYQETLQMLEEKCRLQGYRFDSESIEVYKRASVQYTEIAANTGIPYYQALLKCRFQIAGDILRASYLEGNQRQCWKTLVSPSEMQDYLRALPFEEAKPLILRLMEVKEEVGFERYAFFLRDQEPASEDYFGEEDEVRCERIEQAASFSPAMTALYLEGLQFGKYGFEQNEERAQSECKTFMTQGNPAAMLHDLMFTHRNPKEMVALSFEYAAKTKNAGIINFLLLTIRVHLQKSPHLLKEFLPLKDRLCDLGVKGLTFYESLAPTEIKKIQGIM